MGFDIGKWNTMGKAKCSHCGLYFEDNTIGSHEDACNLNPDNQGE